MAELYANFLAISNVEPNCSYTHLVLSDTITVRVDKSLVSVNSTDIQSIEEGIEKLQEIMKLYI